MDEKRAATHDLTASGGSQAEHRPSSTTGANGSLSRALGFHEGDAARQSVRDSPLYKRILGQSLRQSGLASTRRDVTRANSVSTVVASPHIVPPREGSGGSGSGGGGGDGVGPTEGNSPSTLIRIPGLSEQENRNLAHEVVEVAATAAAVAARDVVTTAPLKPGPSGHPQHHTPRSGHQRGGSLNGDDDGATLEAVSHTGAGGGGHDAPNWSRMKSTVILLGATILYAVIAEILVNTVDVVLENAKIDEKFLGITLFALVPNTTEFLVSPNSPSPNSNLDRPSLFRRVYFFLVLSVWLLWMLIPSLVYIRMRSPLR